MSPRERADLAPCIVRDPHDTGRIVAIDIAKGLLILLAIVPVAALAAPATPVGVRGLAFFSLIGDLLVIPAFMFLAGLVARPDAVRQGAVRRRAVAVVSFVLAVLVAAAAGVATQRGWKTGVLLAIPALRLLILPLLYGLVLRALGQVTPVLLVAVAALLHVLGVILGGSFAAVLAPFVYFVGGALFCARRESFLRLASRERHFAAASGPIVVAVALMFAGRIIPGLHAVRLADIGPATLALGFAAGFAALASAQALVDTLSADMLQRLGRAARPAAIAWLPLFFGLVTLADRGFAPSSASLTLFALASILIVFVVVDLAQGERQQATASPRAR